MASRLCSSRSWLWLLYMVYPAHGAWLTDHGMLIALERKRRGKRKKTPADTRRNELS